MKFFTKVTFLILFICFMNSNAQTKFEPPQTPQRPVTDIIHGFKITDSYRWLEDKENPEVKEWSHKQHDYTINYINQTSNEIAGLKDEIKNYLDRDLVGSPFFKGDREFYYAKYKGEKQNKLYTRLKGKDICIFDPEKFSTDGSAAIAGVDFTKDGNKAAIGIQYKGDEINEYRIIDTKNGKIIGETLHNLQGFSWTFDEKNAYVQLRSKEMIKNQIPVKTLLHKMGESQDNDVFLIAPKDAKDVASYSDDDETPVTFISEGDFYSNTLHIKKAGTDEIPKLIYSSKKYKADPTLKNNKLYFYTNDNAPNYKIMVTDITKPEYENWKTFYAEKETVCEGFIISSDYVVVRDKKDVLGRLTAYDLNGKLVKEIPLPEIANVAGISYHKESNKIFVSLTTFTSATKVYKLDGKTLQWEFFYQDKPPIDTKEIESKQVFYLSKDSTKVPMFIVYKKGLKLDGSNPTMLYGYGGFNITMGPNFIGTTASFINRGGIYAVACLRGGDEYGENWHKNGMLFKKQNTFDDFISAAEYLINEKYTSNEKLVVRGGSNGGLLIGAMITQRPDLFKAAVCAVPLLDMLRFHKFLIARYWIPEYGDPEKKEDFLNILRYTPYNNIKSGFNYPTTLVKAGENDSRVDPLHAKKFVAALQNNPGQIEPIMLFVDFDSGHGSGQSTDHMVNNIELEWRFVMSRLGMK